jgi:hypothetical protein
VEEVCLPNFLFVQRLWLTASKGWGNGFLSTLVNGANGTNFGHNGATTVSFVKGGDWANVLSAVTSHKEEYDPYVTIQVG